MSKKSTPADADLPRHARKEPGAEIAMTRHDDGSVTVSFSDGSDDLEVSRREFMRITGVAAASAAVSGAACRNPVEKIVPYVDRPEKVRVGMPNQYASVCNACPAQCGMLVQTRVGRPVKLEGNPRHPVGEGALCARGQSHYLDLYDPDRARMPLEVSEDDNHTQRSFEEVDRAVVNKLEEVRKGGRVRILTGALTGSAQRALLDEITSTFDRAEHYSWEPVNHEALLTANAVGYGARALPHYRFDEADLVVSLGSDFLGTWLSPVEFSRQFSRRRDPDSEERSMSRLVAFEGAMTLTGANADDRHRVRASDLVYVALALAHQIIVEEKKARVSGVGSALAPFSIEKVAPAIGVEASVLESLAGELVEHRGASLVVGGGTSSMSENGIALESAINLLNHALGNVGTTIEWDRPSRQNGGSLSELAKLVEEMEAGEVDVLIIDGVNPAFDAPPALGFTEALEKVPFVVSTSDRVDETAKYAKYLANGTHDIEAWGDSNPFEGVYSIRQPAIQPMFVARSLEDSLMTWFGTSKLVSRFEEFFGEPDPGTYAAGEAEVYTGPFYRFLREHWEKELFPNARSAASFDEFWEAVLRAGVWTDEAATRSEPTFRARKAVTLFPTEPPKKRDSKPGSLENKELQLIVSVPMYDGRHANNGHLQELPDPITKHVWGPYVMVSPRTFREAGLSNGQFVEVKPLGTERAHRFQVIMQPGLHDDVVAIPVGWGRERVGDVGDDLGANAFDFSSMSEDKRQVFSGIEVAVAPTELADDLAVVQGSQIIDLHKRDIMAATTLEAYKEDKTSGIHKHPPLKDLWEDHEYKVKWGMSIDMSKCTGCSACVTACQEENNTPVVGRQGILEGREMHWMRLDRYYKLPDNEETREMRKRVVDDPMYEAEPYVAMSEHIENPRVLMQPMLCQHCENAPCETVCPVLATTHSDDGINQMTYNRCVGTRYCSNNCPYKVRRFNWYNYSQDRSDSFLTNFYPEIEEHSRLNVAEPLPMGMNPEVTVRSRGVMEKCTFCVQRIRRAKWQMRKAGRKRLRDGDVVTACQQTCPVGAIEFGDLLDDDHQVHDAHASPRALSVLGSIGTESSIAYLTSVWHTDKLAAGETFGPGHGHGHGGGGGDEDKKSDGAH